MELKIKKVLKEGGLAIGLGLVSYILGGSFGTVFVLTLLLRYLHEKWGKEDETVPYE